MDSDLKKAVADLEKGLIYADLGGDVYKQEVARQGYSKHRGFRTIVLFKKEDKAFFAYGFPKSKRDNIEDDELKEFKINARRYLSLPDAALEALIESGFLIEIL